MRRRGNARALDEQLTASQRALAESEAEREILEQALLEVRQGIVVIAINDDVAFMNPASAALIRPGATLSQLTPHALQGLVRSARESRTIVEQELEIGRPPRIVLATASPLAAERTLLVLNDLTESRRDEAVRRDFVAAASHELKTPVAAIVATTEALMMALERDPVAVGRFVEQLSNSANQLADLVRDLLDLSRLEGSEEPHEEVALAVLVRFEIARQPEGRIVEDLEALSIDGSRSDLGLAVRNLLDNAIRHTPAEGTVTARVRRVGSDASVEVVDTGEGISSRNLPRIFERFFRADSARSRATGGTGLGLAIVRHVAETHGGSVEAESELGAGSTFRIRLPLNPSRLGGFKPRKPTVLFACVHNAGRSQMAAAFMKHLSKGRVEVLSGGSEPADRINPEVARAMAEVGVDVGSAVPKRWTEEQLRAADVVVTMGCGDECPVYPGKLYEEWEIEDPSGQSIEVVRSIREVVADRVQTLLDRLLQPG
ncbi:hypothetical protein BH18ACT5_BH18ACT5_06680 [soil metagenome]